MNIPLIIGSSVSLFSIITSSLLGIIELSQNYTISKLFLILNTLFNSIILYYFERYSDVIHYHIMNEYMFRSIFHTWTGITLIGISKPSAFMSIIVILYGMWNLSEYNKNRKRNLSVNDMNNNYFDSTSDSSNDITPIENFINNPENFVNNEDYRSNEDL
tara:strand:+ start:2781 stop:3260 length:480 start_codon:yes stop_codon:yes gene_type:complete